MNFFKALFGSKIETQEEKKDLKDSRDFDVLKYDGIRALRSNHSDYAIKCFTHALELKDDLEIRDYLSLAYINQGEIGNAYEQLSKILEQMPENLAVISRMANVAYMMEDYEKMFNLLEKAISLDERNPEVLFLYAKACLGKNQSNDAIEALTKAISINKEYFDAYLLRGETLLKEGKLEKADEDAMFLLENTQDVEEVLILKARIEKANENSSKALSFYDAVLEVNPFSVDAYKERGELKESLGDTKAAKEDFDQAKEISSQVNPQEDIEEKVKQAYMDKNPMGL